MPSTHPAGPTAASPPERARRKSSIERQLPLAIWILLVPLVAGLVFFTYGEVRRDLLLAAGTRMEGSAREVGALFERGVTARLRFMQRVARERKELRAHLTRPTEESAGAARAALEEILESIQAPATAELWTAEGRLAASGVAPKFAEDEITRVLLATAALPSTPGHQPLRTVSEHVVHELITPIAALVEEAENVASAEASSDVGSDAGSDARSADPPTLGWLVLRRVLTSSVGTEMFGRLTGTNATFVVGNRTGDLWTNLVAIVPPPAVDPLDPEQRFFTSADGVDRIGAGIALGESPYVLWVESDATSTLLRADRLLVRMLLVGGLLLVVGGGAGWWISRRVTLPLRAATEAAEAIAEGRSAKRLDVRRRDEVGRLMEAFNVMAARVEEARSDLEARVQARTTDLREAVRQLQDAQDELVRNEKLSTLGQLAGSVGHELRNPLGVMSNAVYYLEMVQDGASPEVREYLAILRRQVSLAEKIVADLLDFTRQGLPQARELSLQTLVEEQVARLGSPPCTLVCELAHDLPPVWADQVQVGQVLFNLLTNAVQALDGRPGGRVTIDARAEGGVVRLAVADTGGGVPAHLRDKIFEPLFTTRARGIGLGLAVSRRLARNNGGDLTLARGDGGACFVLTLPVARPAVLPVEPV